MSDTESRDAVIERLAGELRRPVRVDPAARARVMGAVRGAGPVRRRNAGPLGWLTRPRPVMISPLGGLALAGGIALVLVLGGRDQGASRIAAEPMHRGVPQPTSQAAGATSPASDVQFVLVAPTASRVALVGSFNDWNDGATLMQPTATDGVWSVTVPLARGRHVYAFVVNGSEWIADPSAPRAPDDDFGSPNSVILIGESVT